MHKSIFESDLADKFKISDNAVSPELAIYLNRRVRYKSTASVKKHGTIILSHTFLIKETQLDYRGLPMLRGYFDGDTFGRIIDPDDVEILI